MYVRNVYNVFMSFSVTFDDELSPSFSAGFVDVSVVIPSWPMLTLLSYRTSLFMSLPKSTCVGVNRALLNSQLARK